MSEEISEQETKKPKKKINKKWIILGIVAVALVIAVLLLFVFPNNLQKAESYEYIRTTVLQKTSLSETVTVTGTVSASDTASVTVAESAKYYKIASINVKVGDVVKEGDVIATLDNDDLQESISKAQESYNDSVSSSQKTYDKAVSNYEDTLENHEESLEELYSAKKDADNYRTEKKAERTTAIAYYDSMKTIYDAAVETISDEQSAYDVAKSEYESKKKEFYESSSLDASGNISRDEVTEVDVTAAENKMNDAKRTLDNAKSICSATDPNGVNLYGFDAIESAYNNAVSAKEKAQKEYDAADDAYVLAKERYEAEADSSQLENSKENMEDALERLNDAKSNTDQLDELYDTVDDCTLKATMDGTITAVNATVGSTCNGTVATIQNLDSLIVEVTVSANDIAKLEVGMECNITSDATDNTIKGELYQIDPIAGMNGSFGAKVRVTETNSGLLAGISAQVEIIIKSTEGVFSVPLDAIGTEEDGTSYVLRKTGGEGTEMTFEHVAVTVGESNSYYCEISGDDLAEGDVIRSSSDLTEGIVSSEEGEENLFSLFGGMMGEKSDFEPSGDMPSGGGNMPSGGMPGGGGNGGGMPSGGGPGGM